MEASDVFRKIATGGNGGFNGKGISETEAISKASKTAEELVFRKPLTPQTKQDKDYYFQK